MKHRILTLALLLTPNACAHEGDVSFSIYDTRTDANGSLDIVADACEIWGLECRAVDSHHGRGSITLILTDGPAPDPANEEATLNGVALHRACAPVIWSLDSKYTLAHEIGHVLGLSHVRDETNLMHPSSGRNVSEAQRREVRRNAEELAVCAGGV